jgi:hypothetical protein
MQLAGMGTFWDGCIPAMLFQVSYSFDFLYFRIMIAKTRPPCHFFDPICSRAWSSDRLSAGLRELGVRAQTG